MLYKGYYQQYSYVIYLQIYYKNSLDLYAFSCSELKNSKEIHRIKIGNIAMLMAYESRQELCLTEKNDNITKM